ncbi:Uncharacterised protein [Mycobacteroides abscessus subsp. massiliense]|nr:Uncharacterised protein [Mycobacteroides abscessus subsp. massiliense]
MPAQTDTKNPRIFFEKTLPCTLRSPSFVRGNVELIIFSQPAAHSLGYIFAPSYCDNIVRLDIRFNERPESFGITRIDADRSGGVGEDITKNLIIDIYRAFALHGYRIDCTKHIDETCGLLAIELKDRFQLRHIAARGHLLNAQLADYALLASDL